MPLQIFYRWKCRQQQAFGSTTATVEAIRWCVEEVGRREVALCDLTPLFLPGLFLARDSNQRGLCGGEGDQETDQGSHLKLSITRWGREARIS